MHPEFEDDVPFLAAAGRHAAVPVVVLREAGVAADLLDLVPHHADDAVVHDEPALGAVVVDHIPQPDATRLHQRIPPGRRRMKAVIILHGDGRARRD